MGTKAIDALALEYNACLVTEAESLSRVDTGRGCKRTTSRNADHHAPRPQAAKCSTYVSEPAVAFIDRTMHTGLPAACSPCGWSCLLYNCSCRRCRQPSFWRQPHDAEAHAACSARCRAGICGLDEHKDCAARNVQALKSYMCTSICRPSDHTIRILKQGSRWTAGRTEPRCELGRVISSVLSTCGSHTAHPCQHARMYVQESPTQTEPKGRLCQSNILRPPVVLCGGIKAPDSCMYALARLHTLFHLGHPTLFLQTVRVYSYRPCPVSCLVDAALLFSVYVGIHVYFLSHWMQSATMTSKFRDRWSAEIRSRISLSG